MGHGLGRNQGVWGKGGENWGNLGRIRESLEALGEIRKIGVELGEYGGQLRERDQKFGEFGEIGGKRVIWGKSRKFGGIGSSRAR